MSLFRITETSLDTGDVLYTYLWANSSESAYSIYMQSYCESNSFADISVSKVSGKEVSIYGPKAYDHRN